MHAPPAAAQSLKLRTLSGHWSVHRPLLQQGLPYDGQLTAHGSPGSVAGEFAIAAWYVDSARLLIAARGQASPHASHALPSATPTQSKSETHDWSNDEATIMRDVHAAASTPGLVDASCPAESAATPPQPKPVNAKK